MILSMIVISKERHPNADMLWVYGLRSDFGKPILQVCANLTNVYNVNDIVAVCQEGYDCGDFVIESRKVRGVLSQGMMVGLVDAAINTDVTEMCSARLAS